MGFCAGDGITNVEGFSMRIGDGSVVIRFALLV